MQSPQLNLEPVSISWIPCVLAHLAKEGVGASQDFTLAVMQFPELAQIATVNGKYAGIIFLIRDSDQELNPHFYYASRFLGKNYKSFLNLYFELVKNKKIAEKLILTTKNKIVAKWAREQDLVVKETQTSYSLDTTYICTVA